MKLRRTIKRIVALGTGAAMMGATITGAMAANLSDYPSPFIKSGALNSLILIGDSAKTSDVIGAVDIATSLQYDVKQKASTTTSSAGTVSLSGDSVKIEKSTNKLEVNESVKSIMESVTSSDLTGLKDSSIDNEFGTFDYTQTVYMPTNARIQYAADPDDSKSVAKPYLKFDSSKQVYKYKVSFTPALKSDHNTGSSGYLEDIKNKKITLFGNTYTILKADHTSTHNIELTLMGGAVTDTMDEGQTKTYTLDGKDYEVTLDYVGSTDVKFKVNGETTDTMQEAGTFRLTDGVEVGVVDILAQEFAGGVRKVEFSLGADKIKIADSATNNQNFGATVSVGTEDMTALKADIVTSSDGGTGSGNDTYISSLEFEYNASSALYLAPGDKASIKADVSEAQTGNFLASAFDYRYEGLQVGKSEAIGLKPSGSNNYKLQFTNKAGVEYNADIIGYNASHFMFGRYTGSSWYYLVTNEALNISDEYYFIVSKNDYSRILQFKDINPGTSTTDNMGTIKVKDLGSGNLIDVTYSGSDKEGSLILDGNTYLVRASSDASSAKIKVDFDGDGTFTNATWAPQLITQYGANITLMPKDRTGGYGLGGMADEGAVEAYEINITAEETEDNLRDVVNIGFRNSGDGKIDLNDSVIVGVLSSGNDGVGYRTTAMLQNEDGSYKYSWYSKYGVFAEVDRKGSGNTQNDLAVTYPDNEATGAFFVTIGETTATTTSGEGTSETYTINPIVSGMGVTAAKLASSVSDLTAQNIVVVGGPCVNSAAASLMGNPSPCEKDFTEGKAMIKLYNNGNNVALLVAGYSAADTLRAAQVVANHDLYQAQLTGEEVEVSGTSFADVTVSAPAAKTTEETTTEGNETA